jgi:geranylgeranyl diphosphate synthase type I
MRDDVIGAFGAEHETGKPVGGDLREGKPTPLLARAVQAATPSQRTVLDLVGDPSMADDEVARVQQVIVDTGALDDLERHIAQLAASAVAALERAPITEVAKAELAALATYVTSRQL